MENGRWPAVILCSGVIRFLMALQYCTLPILASFADGKFLEFSPSGTHVPVHVYTLDKVSLPFCKLGKSLTLLKEVLRQHKLPISDLSRILQAPFLQT